MKNDQEIVEKIKTILEDLLEKKYTNCGCKTCKSMDVACKDCPKCSEEEMSKNYESENEDEDKWDNIAKACWSGYKQVGMKEKNGKKVPNCVPVEKMDHEEDEKKKPKKEMKKSLWGGAFSPK